MDKLWAPWRINYIKEKKPRGCIFCKSLKMPKEDYIVFRGRHSFCLLNIFPYNNGHLMVAPLRHVKDLSLLKKNELLDLFKSMDIAQKLLNRSLNPTGYNIGINLSRSAGAGIPGHLHIHIVPRWHGDTNFMPVLYNTKIVSQSLNELVKILRQEYAHPKRNKRARR